MPTKKTLLYSLRRKDSSTTHFLFGTMHTRSEGAYTHLALALKYMQGVQKYFAEMNLADAGEMNMSSHFLLPEPTTLSDLYKERHFLRMQKIFLKAFHVDLNQFQRFLPFYIQTIICELVLTPENRLPLDYFLWEEARTAGKEMGGVESVQRQIEILHKIPLSVQVRALKLLAENPTKFRKTIRRLNKAYEKADIILLYTITRKQLGTLRNLMLTERNSRMAQFILDNAKEESSFFAVGAAHLAGKTGILYLLTRKGFVVKPVVS